MKKISSNIKNNLVTSLTGAIAALLSICAVLWPEIFSDTIVSSLSEQARLLIMCVCNFYCALTLIFYAKD